MKKGILLGLVSIVCWSIVFVMGRLLLVRYDMAPIHFAWVRYAIAAPVLLGIIIAQGRLRDIVAELRRPWGFVTYAALGATGCFAMSYFQVLALPYTQATTISMLMALAPFFTLIAAIPLGERITPAKIISLVLGFAGAALITFSTAKAAVQALAGPFPYFGEIMALLSGAAWGVYTAIGKRPAARIGGLASTGLSVSFGLLFFLIGALAIIDGGWPGWIPVIVLSCVGLFGTAIAYATWYAALNYVEAGKLAMLQFLTPVLAYIQAAFILGERITLQAVGGFVLIIAGLVFVTRNPKSPVAEQPVSSADSTASA